MENNRSLFSDDLCGLEAKLVEVKQRIQLSIDLNKQLKNGEEAIHLAFSGGRDSTILLHLIKHGFNDVKRYIHITPEIFYPEVKKNIDELLQDEKNVIGENNNHHNLIGVLKYGMFCGSKMITETLFYYQKYVNSDIKPECGNKRVNGMKGIDNGKMLRIMEGIDRGDVKINNKCCRLIKNSKRTNKNGTLTGMRRGELNRSKINCKNTKNKTINPLIYITNSEEKEIIEMFNIKIPSCYTGTSRTGCLGCPYSMSSRKKGDLFASHYPAYFEVLKKTGLYDFLSKYGWRD